MPTITEYTNNNKKINLSDFNLIIDTVNKINKKSEQLEFNYTESLPAQITLSGSNSILIRKFNWVRNGNDCTILTQEIGNSSGGLNLEDKYLTLSFVGGDYTTTTEYPDLDGMVYIGAVLSNCSSTENNNNFSEILDGTVVQLSNPRVTPTKMHIVKLPISTYNNSNSRVNSSFFNDSMCVIGGIKIDNTGNICDYYQYHTGHINDYYKDFPFEAYIFNNDGIKINNGNITDNITTTPFTSNSWDSPDYNTFSTGTNYVYGYIYSGSVELYVSTVQNEYPDRYLICTVEFNGTRITNIIQNQNQDIQLGGGTEANENPTYYTTISRDTHGTYPNIDPIVTDSWTYGDQDSSNNDLGLWLYAVTRVGYDSSASGEKQINIFVRKMIFTTGGKLHTIGNEIKYSIPTVAHSTI